MTQYSLDFEDHLKEQKWVNGEGDFAERQAESMHALVVFNPLRDAALDSIKCAETLTIPGAQFQLRHGAARRLLMSWRAYRNLIFSVPSDRTDPIPHEDLHSLERDLNVIYINLVGVMDNYAWALLKEFGRGDPPASVQVGLFSKTLAAHDGMARFGDAVSPFAHWNRELRARRDPVAHRIPLTIPPAHLDPSQAAQYQALGEHYVAAANALDFDAAEAISCAQGALGSFRPIFMHDPSEPPVPLYPTLPTDCANLLNLMSVLHTYVAARLA